VPRRKKFHTKNDEITLHYKSSSHGPVLRMLICLILCFSCMVNYGKVLCSSANEPQQNSNASSKEKYTINRGVRLIKVSFKVNKGNKFGDFGYCPLNRGCPLNTSFTVFYKY